MDPGVTHEHLLMSLLLEDFSDSWSCISCSQGRNLPCLGLSLCPSPELGSAARLFLSPPELSIKEPTVAASPEEHHKDNGTCEAVKKIWDFKKQIIKLQPNRKQELEGFLSVVSVLLPDGLETTPPNLGVFHQNILAVQL